MANEPNLGGRLALLVVDVINDLEFSGREKVLPWATKMVEKFGPVIRRTRDTGVPVIYANDNFGHWRSNFKDVVSHCTLEGARGREIARALSPGEHDDFVLKPRYSAFFSTSLAPLLEHLKVNHLVLAGIATNLCVLFTAQDAHMHDYDVTVLSDCCAAESGADHNWALDQLQRFVGSASVPGR